MSVLDVSIVQRVRCLTARSVACVINPLALYVIMIGAFVAPRLVKQLRRLRAHHVVLVQYRQVVSLRVQRPGAATVARHRAARMEFAAVMTHVAFMSYCVRKNGVSFCVLTSVVLSRFVVVYRVVVSVRSLTVLRGDVMRL